MTKYSMITNLKLSTDILNDYPEFEAVNKNWNILSYLNYRYDLNAALAFSKLFMPDFIDYKGCIILSFLFSEERAEEWYEEFDGGIKEVEKMCNLYELCDFFHINNEKNTSEAQFFALGEALRVSWRLNLYQIYPDKKFNIDVFEEYQSIYITFYQEV